MHRRRLLPALAAVATAALVVPLVQAPAAAAPKAQKQGAGYLALGDSVPDAYGVPEESGYVNLLAHALGPVWRDCGAGSCPLPTENLAVSGATTTTLIADQLPQAVATLRARNGNRATADDVRLVTLTIGGNNLFQPTIAACTPRPPSPVPPPTCDQVVAELLTGFARNLAHIVGELTRAGQGKARIAVSTYYNALVGCPLGALARLAAQVLEGDDAGKPSPTSLNGIIRTIAQRSGVTVVETGAVGEPQLSGDCLHPNAAGHALIADAFAAALR